ncbi:DUF4328 domain-containing protein [Parerythrobacter lacustris]|uniref:DUF4328 domain-containing protein n=1 Tax=Parerythrobacter lacustris TaxID=2969984 RepID=A0ABT1XNP4_9SPHN|nr:DUF4328 domain-containing protein [Parerythrobacter lacustris]MCR2833273.1 DUF4328 domain-containing protein [Parerythrobacter lacustris]
MNASQALDSLAFRAKVVRFIGWTFVVLTLLQVGLSGYIAFRPADEIVVTAGGSTDSMTQMFTLAFLSIGLAILWLLSALAFMIMALVWIYRAHANIVEQGVPMDHSPGWAVGSYFVPFLNLVVPFRAMRELYNRSHGEIPEHAHSGVDDVFAWWTAYMVGFFIQCALLFKLAVNELTNLIIYAPLWMEFALSSFVFLLFATAVLMLIKLVGAITEAQRSSAHVGAAFE